MAAGIGNPVGAVLISPWEPKIITAYAKQNITGGCLVFASGAADLVSSGTKSLIAGDIQVATNASGNAFTGVAINTVASGSPLPVALEGIFILRAFGTVTAGATVTCEGTNAVADGATAGQVIGRALTSATSGGFAAVYVRA